MNEAVVAEILRMVQNIDLKMDRTNEKLDNTNAKLDASEERLSKHMEDEEDVLVEVKAQVASLHGAFPEEDIQGHHSYHQSLIERNKWITSLCKDSVKEIAKYGLLGFLGWLLYHLWIDMLAGPHK